MMPPMAFHLDGVVPWGRTFDEYRRMFALTDDHLRGKILGCADGPASFNAEAHGRGYHVVSCDPLYRWDRQQIRQRIDATCDQVLEQARQNVHEFVWTLFRSVDELGRVRARAMDTFLADYEQGRRDGRYVDAELPALPFADSAFDLAVCSHFLFLYSTQLDAAFHIRAIHEMSRVATEVRIFPLLALGATPSIHVEPVCSALRETGFEVSIAAVDYEFQRGGNQMMRIRPARQEMATPGGACGVPSQRGMRR
jgi:hypothetical protein